MKTNPRAAEAALDAPAEGAVFLLHGADEAGSRALADRLKRALGPEADMVELDSAALKAQPGLLAVEAASTSLFGGARHIRVTLAAIDDITPALAELAATPGATAPVVVLAGVLKATNAVLKYALADKRIVAVQSYPLNGDEAGSLAAAMARELGLKLDLPLARRLANAAGGDRAVLARELEKYALYLDAAPERPAALTGELVDALGADAQDGDYTRLTDAVLGGAPAAAAEESARLASEGSAGIPLARAVARRALGLAEQGGMTSSAPKSFNKWEETARRLAANWPPPRLATALDRLLAAERAVKAPGALGSLAVDAELIAIARAARGRR